MRREKLVKKGTKRAIALATALMLTMNQTSVLSIYAEGVEIQTEEKIGIASDSNAQKASDSNTQKASDSNATEIATSSDATLATATGDGTLLDDMQKMILTIDSWYITEYTEISGYYYNSMDEKITDSFICTDLGSEYVIYVGDDGKMETTKWLSEDTLDGKKFRYANADGQVRIGESEVFDDGWYGDFDDEGYWTPISDIMFTDVLADGTQVQYYSDEDGKVAGWTVASAKTYYVYAEKDGKDACWYLIDGDAESLEGATKITNCWISDLYVGKDGKLITSAESVIIDGAIYDFDDDGHSTELDAWYISKYSVTEDYYLDGIGEIITSFFICTDETSEYVIYVNASGIMETTKWIAEVSEDGNKYRYADAQGWVRIDQSNIFYDGWYGNFDEDGYWTPISDIMFTDVLADDTQVQYYSDEDGKVAGWTEEASKDYYIYTIDAEDACWYLIKHDATSIDSATKVTNCWISEFYVGSDGQLIKSQENVTINGSIYNFDENGYSTWIDSSDVWYVTVDGTEEGYYYDSDGMKLTLSYIWDDEKGYIVYVDENGEPVTGEWIQLGSGAEQKTRYVDGIGKVKVDMENVFTGGYYGSFDSYGYFTPTCNQFFDYEAETSDNVMKRYAGDDGAVPFDLVDGVKAYYCFLIQEGESTRCYRSEKDQVISDTSDLTLLTNIWIDDMRVSDEGIFLTNLENVKIDNQYYNFDADGHATLINTWYETAYELKDDIYYDINGTVFSDAYIYDEDLQYIVYVVDGVKCTGKWISVTVDGETKFRYVDGKGKVKIDDENSYVGGCFGNFDTEGYWTPLENQYFTIEFLDEDVQRYAGEGGNVTSGYILRTIGEEELWYAIANSASSMDEAVLATGVWIDSFYIGADSKFVTNYENYFISNQYYDFDVDGYSNLVTSRYITDGENSYYVDAEGILVTDAFVTVDDKTYYFGTDGAQVIGPKLISIGEDVYCIGETGEQVISAFATIDGSTYYFGEDGIKITTQQLVTIDGKEYCINASGEQVISAFATVEEGTYYFGTDGIKMTGQQLITIGSDVYCISETGEQIISAFATVDGKTYYFGADGVRVTEQQLVTIGGQIYCINANGEKVTNAFATIDGKTYYFGAEGVQLTGQQLIVIDGDVVYCINDAGEMIVSAFATLEDGKTYYFGTDGIQVTGQQLITIGSDVYCISDTGEQVISAFATIDERTYYFGADGIRITTQQLVTIDGSVYCIDANGEKIISAFATVEGKTYYFGADGSQITGQQLVYVGDTIYCIDDVGEMIVSAFATVEDARTYYFGADGVKVTGVQLITIGDAVYCIDESGEMVIDTFATVEGKIYYFGTDGIKITTQQLVTIDGQVYCVDANGEKIISAFATVEGKTYYFGSEGAKVTGQQLVYVDDAVYCIDDAGEMIVSAFATVDEGTCYFGTDGQQWFKKWIGSDADGWKYVDSEGYMIADETKIIASTYGVFDSEGFWHAIENQFFTSTFNGVEVMRYVGEDGSILGIGDEFESTSFFCFVEDAMGTYCYLLVNGQDPTTAQPATDTWIADMKTDESGYLIKDDYAVIDDACYRFTEEGISKVLVNQLFVIIIDEEYYKVYADEYGNPVKDAYIYYEADGEYLYFDEDGYLVSKHWIGSNAEGWKYADSNGYILRNTTTATGNVYGTFDADGWWEAISYTFFESTLSSGATVVRYSGEEGKIAGVGNDASDTSYYCFEETSNGTYCYMLENQQDPTTAQAAANVWVYDMRIDENGYMLKDCDASVDGVYYHFDTDGHGVINTYTVSYVLSGGTNNSQNPVSYTGEMDAILLSTPVRSGYTFLGWYTDSSYKNAISEIASKSFGNMTLYAKWENNSQDDSSDDEVVTTAPESTETTQPSTTITPEITETPSVTVSIPTTTNEPITVTTGETTVSAVTSQTSEGSVNNNTIISVTEQATVTVTEGQTAEIATIAVGEDGSTRSLLASETLGATVQQVTTTATDGTQVVQNVVQYADGTQVTQKSGTDELEGFGESVVAAEQAIQNGTQSVADVYNEMVELDLHQYDQVGAAVTFGVTAGTSGATSQTQMEQTSFTAGQEITALITGADGIVTTVTVIVGENGIIQYDIPMTNCVVRYLVPKTQA